MIEMLGKDMDVKLWSKKNCFGLFMDKKRDEWVFHVRNLNYLSVYRTEILGCGTASRPHQTPFWLKPQRELQVKAFKRDPHLTSLHEKSHLKKLLGDSGEISFYIFSLTLAFIVCVLVEHRDCCHQSEYHTQSPFIVASAVKWQCHY